MQITDPNRTMTDIRQKNHAVKKNCEGCGGSGQISFFRGVSRFVMDWDDCPDCLGTGYIEVDIKDRQPPEKMTKSPTD